MLVLSPLITITLTINPLESSSSEPENGFHSTDSAPVFRPQEGQSFQDGERLRFQPELQGVFG
jgi:hypothetical protein